MSHQEYESKKKRLKAELLKKLEEEGSVRLGKETSNLFRNRKENTSTINVRDFNNVIHVNTKEQYVEVEGMTTYEKLTDATLKHGFMPTVVPELKSITIGGAITGVGIESSSFKYGLVHETVQELEVLLPDGKMVICTPENEHKDLFFGFPNSYGTLGYALKIKVKIVPIKKYVKITHQKFDNAKNFFKQLEVECKNKDYDFVDGTIFSNKEHYITIGQFTDKAPKTSDYKGMNMYFQSIKKNKEDFLTTKDYIWRWDTDWFWCSKHFGVQNKFLRFFIPRSWLKSTTYWKIKAWNAKYKFAERLGKIFGASKVESVVQDVEIPVENCEQFMEFFHKEIKIKPVWVCPLTTYNPQVEFDLYKMNAEKLYVNFGFWDVVKTTHEKGFFNKKIEQKVQDLNGKKSLYSTSFYTEEKFWQLYNKEKYDALKKKYDPQNKLKNIYDKCVKRK